MKRLLPLLVALVALPAFAQDPPPPPSTGFPPYGSFEFLAFDSVNRQNLNVHFAIPVISSPGRGFDLSHAVTYDSAIFMVKNNAWSPLVDSNGLPTWGWRVDLTVGSIASANQIAQCPNQWCDEGGYPCLPGGSSRLWRDFTFTDPSGTKHEFPVAFYEHPTLGCPDWGSEPRTGHAADGSGYFLDATNPAAPFVLTPSGHRIDANQKLTDPNGNFIQRVTTSPNHFEWKDTRGKAALKIDLTPGYYVDFRVLDPNGTYQTTRVHYQSFQIVTDFDCPGIQEYTGTALLPTRIDLPNGQFWSFAYENTPGNLFGTPKTGRLASVTLPTGGIIGYAYNSPNMGVSCEDGAAASMTRLDAVGSWTFDRVKIGGTWKTFVGAPALSYDNYRSEHTFSDGRQTKEQVFSGESLLRTVDTTWTTGSPPTPKARVVTLDDGKKSKVETDFDPQSGNLLAVREYAFQSGSQYALVRRTENTYLAEPEYVARNIRNRLASQVVKDGANQVVSRTDIVHDDYPQEPMVCVTGAPQHDDTNYGCSFETRGNPTHVKRYLDPATATNPIVRAVQYDSLGNARTADLDCCQERQFNFSATTGWAMPDSIVSGPPGGPQLTVSSTYNPHTGLVATTTDANGQVTSFGYDLWKRPTSVTRPGGTQFTTVYDDVARTVTTTAPVTATTSRKSKTYFDTYGRPFKTELRDGADTLIAFTESQFDSMGRAWRTSNPRGSPSDPAYWTESRWDALGRPTVVIPPDGTATSNSTRYSYLGNQVTVTDPAGNQKKTVSDALGRMVELWEPNPASPSELLLTTQYAWTTLGNLSTVTQGSQTRSYTWDALGRMTSETTPEAGTVKYTVIDSYGNVRERVVDPVNPTDEIDDVTTIFSYDGLNRLTGVSWEVATGLSIPATPPISYVYGTDTDGTPNDTGRLKTITDGLGTETLSYDLLGRVTDRQRVIDGQSFSFHYTHNLADEVTSVTYPSGRVVNYGQDPVGRLTTVSTGGTNLLSNLAWSPAGLPTGWTYGNGVTASFGWTPERLLLSEIRYDRPQQGGTMFNLTYEYGTAAGNDGRIKKINDMVVPERTLSYEFDALGRLLSAETTGGATYPKWCIGWTYDSQANRLSQRNLNGETRPEGGTYVCPGLAPELSLAFESATNRVSTTGWTHDASGNVKTYDFAPTEQGGDGSFSIDAAGRTIGHTPGADPPITFAFDATGLRTKRTEGAGTTFYLRDGGQVIGEWNGTSWTKEYVWLGSTLLATIEGSTIKYHHADHLSIRATTFADGMIGEEQGHYPFGEPWYETSPETTRIFTTYEREVGGSLDYAMFRWMGPEAGRFLSADPISGGFGDGQSWNRYAYAGNDPVNRWDPWGLYFTDDPGPSDFGLGDGPSSGGGGGGGGSSQCDPYEVSICRNTQTGEIVTCCCSGGRWVQCDFTVSEADPEPIDPIERHDNWIRGTDEALGPLDENPYFGGGRGAGGGPIDGAAACDVGSCLLECTADQLGVTTAIGGASVFLGSETVAKTRLGGALGGSSDGTSIASSWLRKAFPQRAEKRIWAPTLRTGLRGGTKSVGGALGRWVPVAGWVLLTSDALSIGACTLYCTSCGGS